MEERDVISVFVTHLGKLNGVVPSLSVDRWPDKMNRKSPDIDAVAGAFAVEHTSVDTVADQRLRGDWFSRVVEGLDEVINEHVDGGLTITLEFDAIGKGQDWSRVRGDLERWIVEDAPLLDDGTHEVVLPQSGSDPSPIQMLVWRLRGLPIVGFSRFEPEDDTLSTRVRRLLDRKAEKLIPYQGRTLTTILLVESDDIALMDETKMLDAIRAAYADGLPRGVDELWYADTSIPSAPLFHDFTPLVSP